MCYFVSSESRHRCPDRSKDLSRVSRLNPIWFSRAERLLAMDAIAGAELIVRWSQTNPAEIGDLQWLLEVARSDWRRYREWKVIAGIR